MAVVINPSVNVNIVYSTEYDWKYLINNGIASVGDLIIDGSTNGGNGVLHIQDTDFFLAGYTLYKNGIAYKSTLAPFIKSNTVNRGDIGFTGDVSANSVTADNVAFNKLSYNRTGKLLVRVNEGSDNVPWKLVFERNVLPSVDDIIVDGNYLTKTYLTQTDTSLLFLTKVDARYDVSTLTNLIYNTSTNIYHNINSSLYTINRLIENTDTSIMRLRTDIFNTSTYNYVVPFNSLVDATAITTVKQALNVLLYERSYTLPEDVSVICTQSADTFIKGKRLSESISFSWRMMNYNTESQHRSYTKQIYDGGEPTSNLFTYTVNISPTEILNATEDIRKTLIIRNDYLDARNNFAKPFEYEFVAKIITEEYYYITANSTIGSNLTTFAYNMVPIDYIETDDGYKKFVCSIGSTPSYIFFVLDRPDMPSFYLYDSDNAGILGDKSLEGGVIKIQLTISLTKYNKAITYTLYRTNQKLTGNVCIQFK